MTDTPPRKSLGIGEAALARTAARPRPPTRAQIEAEKERCAGDPVYFIDTYCQIYDSVTKSWIPFKLWPAQRRTVGEWMVSKFMVVMKARQEGFTWLLGDCLTLWQMLFAPIAEVLLFSQREDEAFDLLDRVRGTYKRLPVWMQEDITKDAAGEFRIANGSGAVALTGSSGGRSHAATYVVIDESDFIPDLARLVSFAKPTIDAGTNKMVMLSTVNDVTQGSYFVRLYETAKNGLNDWLPLFFGWFEHPGRTQEWYDREKQNSFNEHGSYDYWLKQYPATDTEAMAGRTLNVRYSPQFLSALSRARDGLPSPWSIPGLRLFILPQPGHAYGIGVDPAGGLTDSDDSYAQIIDADTLEQCAVLQSKTEPTEFANHVYALSEAFGSAPVLPELNNHGLTFLAQAKFLGMTLRMGMNRRGNTERDPGWITSNRSKGDLFDTGAKAIEQVLAETKGDGEMYQLTYARPILFDRPTIAQLGSIDINTLSAPEGGHDDAAMSWVLAIKCVFRGGSSATKLTHNLWQLAEPAALSALTPSIVVENADGTALTRYRTSKRFKENE